jgi:acetyl esterase/lipase
MAEMPPFETLIRMPVVLRVPGMDEVDVRRDVVYGEREDARLAMDVYRPTHATDALPGVLLVHGGPIPRLGAKNMGVFTSYGRLLAASGLVAIAFDHRFLAPERLTDAGSDVEAAIAYAREHADELALDRDRLAVWAFSGGGPLLSVAMRGAPTHVRALLAFYAALDISEKAPGSTAAIDDDTRRAFSPVHHLRAEAGRLPPVLVARAGLDFPFHNATVDRFVAEALATNASLELLTHPQGRHGFDILDDVPRSREILARAVEFLRTHLA